MLSCWLLATVDDTISVQPLKQTHGFSLWSSAYRQRPRRRRYCFRLPAAPSRAPLLRCRWLRPLHLTREAPQLCHVKTVLPSPEDILLF